MLYMDSGAIVTTLVFLAALVQVTDCKGMQNRRILGVTILVFLAALVQQIRGCDQDRDP